MQDLSLHYISNSNSRLWKRHETIGNIKEFKFLDITEPAEAKSEIIHFMKHLESMDDSLTKIPVKILTRYTHHFQKLVSFLSNLPAYIQQKMSPHDDTFEKDDFGFKKILVGLSHNHDTMVGLQSNNGNLLWTLHFSKVVQDAGLFSGSDDELVFSDFHVIEREEDDNEAVVIVSTKSKNSLLIIVDPYSGVVKDTQIYKGRQVRNTFKIHLTSLHEVVLFVDSDKKSSFYPLELTEEEISYYEFNESEKGLEIVGESYDVHSCTDSKSKDPCLSLSWKVPLTGQKLIAYSAKYAPERAHFHSQRATNLNGAILFKYLEPTLFAIATTAINGGGVDNALSVYIVEGSTGRIVHQFLEKNVMLDKPINLLLDENMLILTFQRMGKLGEGVQQIQTVDLYEQNISHHARDVIVDYLSGKNSTSLYGEMPIVIQQAYIFPYVISSLGITRTMQGITGKDLLLILENNQVYALKQLLISPRRPISETMNENIDLDLTSNLQNRELMPYDAYLPFTPQAVISHRHKLIGLRKITTAASRMESTSLAISFGSDLFYSTVAPEKQFDVLSEDFKKSYLLLTCLGLMILTKVSTWYFNKKRLRDKMNNE